MKPTAPVAEVLKLADSGVEESVMLAFVTNSTSTFNLGAEEIIYLNDIGVPSAVVTAMIQRDQALKASLAYAGPGPAAPAPAPAEPAPAAPEPPPALAPADMAPQPDDTAGNYPPPADTADAAFYDALAPYGTWVDVAGYGALLAAHRGGPQPRLAALLQWRPLGLYRLRLVLALGLLLGLGAIPLWPLVPP